jgi:hypothetical protein
VPAPAVIPAPIAYINVAAVKGFVVECGVLGGASAFAVATSLLCHRWDRCTADSGLNWSGNAVE